MGQDGEGSALVGRSGGYDPAGAIFTPGKRSRINLVAICVNIFLPWFVFSFLFAMQSFTFHYQYPNLAFLIVLAAFVLVLFAFILREKSRKADRDPMWYTFAAVTLFLAVLAGSILGDLNFIYNMQPYYDVKNMNTYPAVEPEVTTGQEVMDAGRAYFSDNTVLDLKRSMSFMNVDLYCVCPIVRGVNKDDTYDFWAVGINCCSGTSSDFRCGEYNNPHARSGLRLMRDDQRPFFRLAVQQAEATYKMSSTHPLFFYWLQDPVAVMNSYRDNGFKYYLVAVFTHFAFNLFCVVCAVVGFSKIGRY